ncbi:MAG: DUF2922 domain-containing protein [Schwartzia sp.]|nr:DUF2922 domain-containing protein [Schwartzia sp. (in: firmicutes)]
MAKSLKMTFALDSGKEHTMNLSAPRNDLTAEIVRPVMETIVAKDALSVSGAKASAAKEAIIREVTETKLF